jgi:hypothetical protein
MDNEQVLWECQDQMNPDYRLKVVRMSPYRGQLSVFFKDNPFFTVEVPVMFDAKFGVDFSDMEQWGMIACKATQEDEAKRAGR